MLRSGQWNWNEHQFYAVATHGQKQVAVGQVGHGAAVGDGTGGRHVALDEKKRWPTLEWPEWCMGQIYMYIYIYYRERERAVWSWPCWIWQRSMLNGAIEIQLDTKTLGRSGIKKGWGMQPKSKINETHMKQSIHRFLTCGWLVMVGLLHIVSNGCLGKLLNGQFTVRSVLVNEWPVLTRIWWGNIQPVLQHMFYSLVHQISVGFRRKWKVLPKNWDFIPISSQDTNPFKSFQNLSGKVMLETLEVGSFSVSSKRMIGVKLVGRKPPSKGW